MNTLMNNFNSWNTYMEENTRWSVHIYKKSWKIGKSRSTNENIYQIEASKKKFPVHELIKVTKFHCDFKENICR